VGVESRLPSSEVIRPEKFHPDVVVSARSVTSAPSSVID